MVRYPSDDRRSLANLENMRIRTPNGGEVPFSQVAEVQPGRGFASIKRVNRNRAVNVTAGVDPAVTSAGAVIADLRTRILPEVLAGHPGVFYTFEGAQAEQADSVSGLQRGFMLAVLTIFILLAIPLRSYLQPLIIMAAIPFGLVGALWGHIVMGLDVTMMSMFGLVALTGVVVNDSLVMVDFINRARRVHSDLGRRIREAGGRQESRHAFASSGLQLAIREAGSNRFRAHPAHVADDVRRPGAAHARPQRAGGVPGADGGLAGLRRAVRHLHHVDPGAGLVPHPGRRAADAAAAVRNRGLERRSDGGARYRAVWGAADRRLRMIQCGHFAVSA